jgi:PPK2 family polyphosphate:nucleotide phosphotransferase
MRPGGTMTIKTSDYCVREGEKVDLSKRPTSTTPVYASKKEYGALLSQHVERLSKEQYLLYASDSVALLIILQGMDSAGKDGVISHVMSGVNPQGCEVHSFKQPSAEELHHDFLWRCHARVPERGRIGIFNRSYYEDALVVRVHPEILVNAGLTADAGAHKKFWKARYRSIVDFERHLDKNGTRVVKLFLHLSKEEQRQRFLARIDEAEKNWKFSMADVTERRFWDDYMEAYEDCLRETSTKHAPWFVVPADDKQNARLIVSEIILETLERMGLSYPETSPDHLKELETLRKELAKPE